MTYIEWLERVFHPEKSIRIGELVDKGNTPDCKSGAQAREVRFLHSPPKEKSYTMKRLIGMYR